MGEKHSMKKEQTMEIREIVAAMKEDSYRMASLPFAVRNTILQKIKDALLCRKEDIFSANEIDLQNADQNGLPETIKKRLKFDEKKLMDVTAGIDMLISLEDPIGKVQLKRELDEGLLLERVTCPLGVIGIIFEARPDALVQISSLCIKSGNCAVLKGGKETAHTNQVLFEVIYRAALEAGAPKRCLYQATQHSEIDELLSCHGLVDLLIPRGSNAFVQYIMEHTRIPVMGHSDGICHTYLDRDADGEKACRILIDAKTQYTAACNATEVLLVDKKIKKEVFLSVIEELQAHQVAIRISPEAAELLSKDMQSAKHCIVQPREALNREYLDMEISVLLVDGAEEAVSHINRYGSHHTDCIITENKKTAEQFMQTVDSAGVYQNCSTRFADGFRYGFGAEVGISTGKLHARGPVGLEGLTTYKYKLYGNGHIVEDYAKGKKQFHFQTF